MCGFGLLLLFVWLFVLLLFFFLMWHGGLCSGACIGRIWSTVVRFFSSIVWVYG